MVVTAVWIPSWSVVVISISVLTAAMSLLICCLCFQKKRTESLDFTIPSYRKIVNFSSSSLNKLITFRYFDSNKECRKIVEEEKHGSESGLLDSTDATERFGSSQLKIDLESLDRDELMSCGSADSMFTFYSTYPCVKADSDSDTFKSTKNSIGRISCSNVFIV